MGTSLTKTVINYFSIRHKSNIVAKAKIYPFNNILLLFATIPVAAWLSWRSRHFQGDDALIYLRYIRNLFDGFGLNYNIGDHFNGLTSPLYSYILIIVNSVTHSPQYTTIFLSFVFLCAAAIYGAAILSENYFEQALCGFFVVSCNYFYGTFGMETTLFLLLTALALYLYQNDKLYWVGATIGLLILTRTEGVLLGFVLLIHYTIVKKRIPNFRYFIAPTCFILANLLFNYIYYGAPLPATGNAKIGQGHSGFWGTGYPFLDISYIKGFFGGNNNLFWFLFPTAIIGLVSKRTLFISYLIVVYLILLGGFYIFLLIPNYHWYYAPFFYFLLIYSALGACELMSFFISLAKKRNEFWIGVVLAAIIISTFGIYNLTIASVGWNGLNRLPYKNIGQWIDDNTPKNSTLATTEIGTIGWYGNRYIIDILGLTNPYNADFIADKNVHAWLTRYSPDSILVHDPLWVFEGISTCLTHSAAYILTPHFDFPGYNLLVKSMNPGAREHAVACGYAQQPDWQNLEHSGETGADTVYLRISPVTGLPWSESASHLIDFFGRYDIVDYFDPYIQFARRDGPLTASVATQSFKSIAASLGQPVDVPSTDPVWVTIDIKPNTIGKLISLVYPIPLNIDLALDNGTTVQHHITPSMGQTGFLLSPYLSEARDVIALKTGVLGISPTVKSFKIASEFPVLWKNNFNVAFSHIDLKPQSNARAWIVTEPLQSPPELLTKPSAEPTPLCTIDSIDGKPFSSNMKVNATNGMLKIRGWSAPAAAIHAQSVQTYFVLQNASETKYYMANKMERPDVAAALGRPELHSAGFDVTLDIGSKHSPGTLRMYNVADGIAYRCPINIPIQ